MEGASQTAVMTAMGRGAHQLIDPDPIFRDPYALALAGKTEADVVEFFKASAPQRVWHVGRLFHCQRSRFVEEAVERAVASGVDQFVDLGAGLSSFAWRRTAFKRERIDAIALCSPPNMHFVAVDFTAGQSLANALTVEGFKPSKSSIWSWLGVVHYLPVDAIRSTLGDVAELAAPGSTLIVSFGVLDEFMEPASREFAEVVRALTERTGEPQITWLSPEQMETIARDAGWRLVRSVDPASFAPWFASRSDGLEPVRYEWLLVVEK
jgi:O-methyltransferase involved in polyketide biosynthesis